MDIIRSVTKSTLLCSPFFYLFLGTDSHYSRCTDWSLRTTNRTSVLSWFRHLFVGSKLTSQLPSRDLTSPSHLYTDVINL